MKLYDSFKDVKKKNLIEVFLEVRDPEFRALSMFLAALKGPQEFRQLVFVIVCFVGNTIYLE